MDALVTKSVPGAFWMHFNQKFLLSRRYHCRWSANNWYNIRQSRVLHPLVFWHVFSQYSQSLLFLRPGPGIVSGKPSGLFKCTVRKLISVGADNNMRSGSIFCMEPPVIADCKFEGQPVVLQVILSDINMISVTGKIVQWFVLIFTFFLVNLRRI